jgi:hypothetical protein
MREYLYTYTARDIEPIIDLLGEALRLVEKGANDEHDHASRVSAHQLAGRIREAIARKY